MVNKEFLILKGSCAYRIEGQQEQQQKCHKYKGAFLGTLRSPEDKNLLPQSALNSSKDYGSVNPDLGQTNMQIDSVFPVMPSPYKY